MMNQPTQLAQNVLALTGNGDRTTDRAREVVDLAIATANESRSPALDSGHLLSGLVREGVGVAAHILQSVGVQAAELDRLLAGPAANSSAAIGAPLKIDGDLKIALSTTWTLAASMNHNFIGTEHMLLAIVSQKCRAYEVLKQLGIESELVASKIRAMIQRPQVTG